MKNFTRVVSTHDLLNELEAKLSAGDTADTRPVAEIIADLRRSASSPSVRDVLESPLDFSRGTGELVIRPGTGMSAALDFAWHAVSSVEGVLTSAVNDGTDLCNDLVDILALKLRPAALAISVVHEALLRPQLQAFESGLMPSEEQRAA